MIGLCSGGTTLGWGGGQVHHISTARVYILSRTGPYTLTTATFVHKISVGTCKLGYFSSIGIRSVVYATPILTHHILDHTPDLFHYQGLVEMRSWYSCPRVACIYLLGLYRCRIYGVATLVGREKRIGRWNMEKCGVCIVGMEEDCP